jgi:hypothetical protein
MPRPSHRARRLLHTCLLALIAAVAWPGSASAATAPAYVTPLIAHTAWTATDGCAAVPGVVTLPNILAGHAQRGYHPTGTLVTDWAKASSRNCIEHLALQPFPKPLLMPSWADIANLHTTYPWFDLASASRDYKELTSSTSTSFWQTEACGSASVIIGHGFTSPLSLFAYPNNKFTATMNTWVLGHCPYTLGRRYNGQANTRTSVQSGLLNVFSINGGHCADAALACSNLSTRFAYTPSATLAALFHPAAGTWVVPQFYRLVAGTRSTGRLRWNCNGAASSHYTFDTGGDSTELYCATDYYAALANEPGYVVKNQTIRQVEAGWGL